jgi:hypothetical protein
MTKIAINKNFGCFSLSQAAVEVCRAGELDIDQYGRDSDGVDVARNHPILIQAIEGLGHKASGRLGKVALVEIPDDVDDWYIIDYDGIESVHEGRQWGSEVFQATRFVNCSLMNEDYEFVNKPIRIEL